jgi:hypothetical protein
MMKNAALAAVLALSLRTDGGASAAEPRARVRPPCCFAHPQYAGVCVVHPGKGETCANILRYLNRPQSIGKSYCRNSTVRSGWTRVGCINGDRPR